MFGFNFFKVTGESMAPAIPAGCFILAARWLMIFKVKEGQTMVINHPKYGVIVKTVAMVDKNGFVWSRGGNNNSLSVEQLGPVYKHQILGRVIRVFTPKAIDRTVRFE
ncbi:nickel-type superoxide dismutase maturation protease [Colwellia sp. E2M01]|uniref:nickel-type superoxide dismutase maturation protease n=1 Tax=Colwellia sp. E2M01 TaxID=2841561 RepID=UPI001C0A2E72|nr:nickel-type superoxide dismutase maturation protease [Colwellia sp. E2M01]MBU2870593.1 nickel-type superoxide dismutase maturation protease [Colwellia sp. E2M01]